MLKFCQKCQTETERNYRGDCKPCKNEWKKAWRKANTEKVKASLAAYRAANKEKMKASGAAWRARNPEYAKIKVAEWKAANPERHAANKRNYKRNRRAKKKSAGGIHTSNDIKQLLSSQKGKCICCKSSIANNYHVDHVIPLALGGRNDKLNLQILCPTCNIRKGAKHPIDFMQSIGMLL
jgi:deoxyribose-phosphate aldolase